MTGGWIALKGGELVASSASSTQAVKQVRAKGVRGAVFHYIRNYQDLKRVL